MHLQLPTTFTDILLTITELTTEAIKVARKIYTVNSTFKNKTACESKSTVFGKEFQTLTTHLVKYSVRFVGVELMST